VGNYAYSPFNSSTPLFLSDYPRKILKSRRPYNNAPRPITQGRDVIAQAQSGTGKTATFSISVLQSMDVMSQEAQALVLSPTCELATQIQSVVGTT
jgi:hypothetical protein